MGENRRDLPALPEQPVAAGPSLDSEILTIGQLYRDRADCENSFDKLKNQWGWAASPPATSRETVNEIVLAAVRLVSDHENVATFGKGRVYRPSQSVLRQHIAPVVSRVRRITLH